jgi:hypothetical protein
MLFTLKNVQRSLLQLKRLRSIKGTDERRLPELLTVCTETLADLRRKFMFSVGDRRFRLNVSMTRDSLAERNKLFTRVHVTRADHTRR